MNNKTKKAIDNLQKQKAKIDGGAADQTWITKTQSCILDSFGKESREFKFIDEFRFTGINTTPETFQSNKLKAKRFIEDCIETLDEKGVYKPPVKNFLHGINSEALAAYIIAALTIIGAVCYQWGKYNSDIQNIELRQTVSKQKDTIDNLRNSIRDSSIISKIKARKKDTIISLQDPAHKDK